MLVTSSWRQARKIEGEGVREGEGGVERERLIAEAGHERDPGGRTQGGDQSFGGRDGRGLRRAGKWKNNNT